MIYLKIGEKNEKIGTMKYSKNDNQILYWGGSSSI